MFNDIDLKCCHHCVEVTHLFQLQEVPPPVRDYRLSSTRKRRCGFWGAGGTTCGTLRSRLSLDGLKKANSVLPRRLEEKKKAQAEKDQLEPTSASVSLPIPDDGRAADQDADADVSPEVENQPDTGQAEVESGEFLDPQKGPFELK